MVLVRNIEYEVVVQGKKTTKARALKITRQPAQVLAALLPCSATTAPFLAAAALSHTTNTHEMQEKQETDLLKSPRRRREHLLEGLFLTTNVRFLRRSTTTLT
jgi:hypothetical protein